VQDLGVDFANVLSPLLGAYVGVIFEVTESALFAVLVVGGE
jgi:hypothetical protein